MTMGARCPHTCSSASNDYEMERDADMDDLAIAFAMRCDEQGLTREEGIEAAERLAGEIEGVADDRPDRETE